MEPTQQPMAPQVLPPASAILDHSISKYREIFWNIAPISLILFLAGMLQVFATLGTSKILVVIAVIINIIVGLLSYIALILMISRPLDAAPLIEDLYNTSRKVFLSYVLVAFLVALSTIGGLTLFILPGIIVSVLLSMTIFVFVEERERGFNALVKSWYYVREKWWQVLWRLIYITLIFIAVMFCIGMVLLIIKVFISGGMGNLTQALKVGTYKGSVGEMIINQALLAFVFIPIQFIYLYYVYFSLRSFKSQPILEVEEKKIKITIQTLAILGVIAIVAFMIFGKQAVLKRTPQIIHSPSAPAAAISALF
jgi:hypothetical protein